MTAPIVVVSEPGRSPLHVVLIEPTEVGRDATGILVNDPAASRRHLELRPDGSKVIATDLGSANGTTLDGDPVEGDVELPPGSVLRFGDTTIRIYGQSSAPPPVAPVDAGLTTISRMAANVADLPPAPPKTVAAEGTVTIVFTDIESSTQLAHRYGDERWFAVLQRHTETVRERLAAFGGTEVKSQGDGFMLIFGSAHRALLCMMEVQRAVVSLGNTAPEMAVTMRVGAHTGEAIVGDDGDLFGHHVNLAARIADQASGGEILVSSLVKEIVESRGDLTFGMSRSAELKGLTGSYLLHPVIWDES